MQTEDNISMDEMPQVAVPEEKLYDLNAIMMGTFLGGPLAGGFLLYSNYIALGEEEGGKSILLWTTLIAVVLFGSLIMLPEHVTEKVPNYVIPWLMAAFAYFIGKKLQGTAIAEHKAQGGALYSKWRAVWVSLVSVLITFALLLTLLFFLPQ
ncbi:hypothetical protein [Pontibacter mangrovi]|uniref:Uncharacterized protein n=1 Tax=Pontibacter mangrovi TaxID=2589816 RepID=A0A501WDY0_9BACT|nr:hypothetical protein [Pontibacter mangrovi]TPE43726.1 hypothetical protein FJM65_13360 [Pontibacter mangrovi]